MKKLHLVLFAIILISIATQSQNINGFPVDSINQKYIKFTLGALKRGVSLVRDYGQMKDSRKVAWIRGDNGDIDALNFCPNMGMSYT